ncbi:MAG: OmpA family protein [Pseudomonadota bacterium]
MRNAIGGLVLLAGIGGLGLWGANSHAGRMEHQIRLAATSIASTALHELTVEVSGRDIAVSGSADSESEKQDILAALDAVEGRRVVVDNLQVLPVAEPFSFAVTRKGGRSIMQGHVPSQAMRAALAESGSDGAEGLTLASGAPDRWESAIGAGLAALTKMEDGALSAEGKSLRLSGMVDTPGDREAILAALTLPEGYELTSDIETRDDGKPVDFTVTVDANTGVAVQGKLPAGLDTAQIADALGVSAVTGDAAAGAPGTPEAAQAALSALAGWLAEFEQLSLRQQGDGIRLTGEVTPGADPALMTRAMQDDLGAGIDIDLSEMRNAPARGTARTNAITGVQERFVSGYWLPDVSFSPSLKACGQQSDSMLKRAKITFLSGSAQLGPRAIRAVNAVASVMRRCVLEAGLRAEIGGHTDTTGSGNYQLSADRAVVVRAAMIARGVPAAALEAVGYGPSKPIADNATETGRAANRRTTIRWARQ